MDDQNVEPKTDQPAAQSTPKIDAKKPTANQSLSGKNKPRAMTEAEAQALLTINSLQATRPVKSPKKIYLYISVAIILVILIALLSALGHASKKSSSGNTTLPNPNNNPVNNGGSINSQVQYCSNPINAATVC